MLTSKSYALLCTLTVFAHTCQSRLLQSSVANGPMCATACSNSVYFKTVQPGQPVSYACAASTEAGDIVGYQLSTGSPTCTIAVDGATVSSPAYRCLCKEPAQTQGLDLPGTSGTCSDSCQQSIDGQVGEAVGGAGSHACLAATEIGTTNRFGHTTGTTCSWGGDAVAQSSSQFSCVCLFSAGRPARAPLQQIQQQISTATAG